MIYINVTRELARNNVLSVVDGELQESRLVIPKEIAFLLIFIYAQFILHFGTYSTCLQEKHGKGYFKVGKCNKRMLYLTR